MFERIISDPEIVENYQPKIWSRPRVPSQDSLDDGDADDDDAVDSPWVITLENFITPQEAQFLIDQGAAIGYHRSADVGKQKADGTYGDDINDQRTSENAWCENACADHPVTVDIMQRIERITGIPATNSESLQLLRYDVGQFCE